jgi:hypothetical protein
MERERMGLGVSREGEGREGVQKLGILLGESMWRSGWG